MPSRFSAATRYARGKFTPFLDPWWGEGGFPSKPRPTGHGELAARVTKDLDARSVMGLASGREAILAALRLLQVPADKAVALPSFGCRGLLTPVLRAGLEPLWLEVGPDLNVEPEQLRSLPADRVGAVIVPHLGGLWTEGMDDIVNWAEDRGIAVIEDAAHAHGSRTPRIAGTQGSVSICSTGVGKVLFGPGGGWLAIFRNDIAERARSLPVIPQRADEVEKKMRHFHDGFLSSKTRRGRRLLATAMSGAAPMDSLVEALEVRAISEPEERIALHHLDNLSAQLSIRKTNAARWRDLMSDHPALRSFRTAPLENNICTKFWAVAPTREAALGFRRVVFRMGVETESLYRPLHLRFPGVGDVIDRLERTEALEGRAFSLPVRANLDTDDWERIERAVSVAAMDQD